VSIIIVKIVSIDDDHDYYNYNDDDDDNNDEEYDDDGTEKWGDTFIYLFRRYIHLYKYLTVHPSIYLSIDLSICPCIHIHRAMYYLPMPS
jgi:hypothetical protein